MKKFLFFTAIILCLQFIAPGIMRAQSCYWVLLTDKQGTTFDPYSYFDDKAIERYRLNNADLYDISNFPLNQNYVSQIKAIVENGRSDDSEFKNQNSELIGESRWLNAVAVMATDDQIAKIEKLAFVKSVDLIAGEMHIAAATKSGSSEEMEALPMAESFTDQLLRMHGELFSGKGFDGTGIRIAVFDGGFHAVNTHKAFEHLRKNNRIIATWNFTKNNDDVYDNHTHGTMVLSCIAGKIDNLKLGLATGATFLLAKTEVDPEPFKEEVWWMQAMEWADKNGADIINSSLGYTKDRHYTWQMDGRSYVSKAANIAARKGILVCNSAGNSGLDDKWKIIGAPADADSILSVGGIAPSLTVYSHIGFSSYGPTADGRMKPNVCNFGYAECSDPHDNEKTKFAAGTSFSAPLTTGFAACAWQTMRDKTAMQMKQLIEQSADLYPYYDYAFGFGVPQADFFVNGDSNNKVNKPTFTFEIRDKAILIHPCVGKNKTVLPNGEEKEDVVLFKIQDNDGRIERYVNLGIANFDETMYVAIPKQSIWGYTLVAHINGYTDSYKLGIYDSIRFAEENHDFEYYVIDTAGHYQNNYKERNNRTLADNNVSNWGVGQRHLMEGAAQFGTMWVFDDDPLKSGIAARISCRYLYSFCKWYGLGVGVEFGAQDYHYQLNQLNQWDNSLGLGPNVNVTRKTFTMATTNLELFQRIRLVKVGKLRHKGLQWDMGVYGGFQFSLYNVRYSGDENNAAASISATYNDVKPASDNRFDWGVTSRVVWDWVGLYGRWRLANNIDLPKFELGVQFSF